MSEIKKLLKKLKLVDVICVAILIFLLIMTVDTVNTNKKRDEMYSKMIESYNSALEINIEQEEVIYNLQEVVIELLERLREK